MRGTVAKRMRFAALKAMDSRATATKPVRLKNGTVAHLPGTKRSIYQDMKLTRKNDLLFWGARWCSRGIMKANWCADIRGLQAPELAQQYVPAARAWASRNHAKTRQVDWPVSMNSESNVGVVG